MLITADDGDPRRIANLCAVFVAEHGLEDAPTWIYVRSDHEDEVPVGRCRVIFRDSGIFQVSEEVSASIDHDALRVLCASAMRRWKIRDQRWPELADLAREIRREAQAGHGKIKEEP